MYRARFDLFDWEGVVLKGVGWCGVGPEKGCWAWVVFGVGLDLVWGVLILRVRFGIGINTRTNFVFS